MTITANDLLQKLIEAGIKKNKGHATLYFMDAPTKITSKSSVGYAFQDWITNWMTTNKIEFRIPNNSQEFPDFYLHPNLNTVSLLEIKTFDADAAANFDVANFDAYTRSLKTQAYKLDADYLIFSYKMNKQGDFTINNIWLKKVWEITCPSSRYPIKTQNKQDVIVNIRPASLTAQKPKFKTFANRREFVTAIYQTLLVYPKRQHESKDWLMKVEENYKFHTHQEL